MADDEKQRNEKGQYVNRRGATNADEVPTREELEARGITEIEAACDDTLLAYRRRMYLSARNPGKAGRIDDRLLFPLVRLILEFELEKMRRQPLPERPRSEEGPKGPSLADLLNGLPAERRRDLMSEVNNGDS